MSRSSVSDRTTVIVLDDNAFVCRALKTQLEILGFDVLIFHSAEAILAKGVPTRDACLLADIYLPGMTGIELDLHLKASGIRLPTILMTGRNDAETARLMREAKPVASLFKPFEPIALERALLKAVRRSARQSK